MAFPKALWAYSRTGCNHMFLKPCHGLQEWREWAHSNNDSALFASVSTLPEVEYKVSADMDGSGMPLGICDRCYCRSKRFKP